MEKKKTGLFLVVSGNELNGRGVRHLPKMGSEGDIC